MRTRVLAIVLAGSTVTAAACGGDGPTNQSGPVTVVFPHVIYDHQGGDTRDTVQGIAILDGVDTIQFPGDSFENVARGEHTIEWVTDIDYLPVVREYNINPRGSSRESIVVGPEGTCRVITIDEQYCGSNVVTYSGSSRLVCPVNDFGEFCSYYGSPYFAGLVWPAGGGLRNEYVGHAKLLVAARMGPGSPAGTLGDTMAMAFYASGDYSPRTRLRAIPGDSSRWQAEAWTDVRHVPVYNFPEPRLPDDDRKADNFGLAVRSTYHIPPALQDAFLVRFDVRNITTDPDYRRVNSEEPVGGHTLTDMYLTPVIDPDIGDVAPGAEGGDDNVTVFPADSLLVGYDQAFQVNNFTEGWNVRPALVGVRLISGPAGTTAKAVLFDRPKAPDYEGALDERTSYRLLAAGREGARTGCNDTQASVFLCSPETPHNPLMGWSVGPITLAPGQSTSLVIAIVLAAPKTGSFTSGTNVAPQNSDVASTARPIYEIAEGLRTLADQAVAFGGFSGAPAASMR